MEGVWTPRWTPESESPHSSRNRFKKSLGLTSTCRLGKGFHDAALTNDKIENRDEAAGPTQRGGTMAPQP